jgi:RHS repeat-associated protein
VLSGVNTFQGYRRYVLGPNPDEVLAFRDFDTGQTLYYPHLDKEGSAIALSSGGQAVEKLAYDAYGQGGGAIADIGPGPTTYPFRYTGQRLDPSTGFYGYKARDYAPALGRFLQTDPAGDAGDLNLYAYVRNDPLNEADPEGLGPEDWWDIAAKIDRATVIGREELRRFNTHNDKGDALRHAEWSYRMVKDVGVNWATFFGLFHELQDTARGQPLNELRMDVHNNTVGIAAAQSDTPIDQKNLITTPMSGKEYSQFSANYGAGAKSSSSASLTQVAHAKGYDSVKINTNGTITGSVTKLGSRISHQTTCDSKGNCTGS